MKKYLLFVGLFVLSALAAGLISLLYKRQPAAPETAPRPARQTWGKIEPGISSLNDVTSELGEKSGTNPETGALEYPVPGKPATKNEVYLSGDTVVFAKQKLFPPEPASLKEHTSAISGEPVIFAGPDAQMDIYLYAYPEAGVAFLANSRADRVYEAWYFSPTTALILSRSAMLLNYRILKQ